MLDLSEGGTSLSFPVEVTVGQQLHLARVDQTALPVRLEIVSASPLDAGSEGMRWQCGARFEDLGVSERRTVKLLLAQLMLEYWR